MLTKIDMATVAKANVNYTESDPWGKEVTVIRNMRFRQVDAILNTEDEVK
jgi:hypothetical protein